MTGALHETKGPMEPLQVSFELPLLIVKPLPTKGIISWRITVDVNSASLVTSITFSRLLPTVTVPKLAGLPPTSPSSPPPPHAQATLAAMGIVFGPTSTATVPSSTSDAARGFRWCDRRENIFSPAGFKGGVLRLQAIEQSCDQTCGGLTENEKLPAFQVDPVARRVCSKRPAPERSRLDQPPDAVATSARSLTAPPLGPVWHC